MTHPRRRADALYSDLFVPDEIKRIRKDVRQFRWLLLGLTVNNFLHGHCNHSGRTYER